MADTQAKIVLAAEDRTARVFAGLKSNLGAVRTQVDATNQSFVGLSPAILGAFSVVGISAFFGKVVDGIDKLNDLADATGSSVENLSGLEDIGARTGTSVDTIGTAVLKLNKNLLDAQDPTSEAAALFKQLGLNVGELSKLDPSQALLKVATALGGFEDGANKSQFMVALLGKSTRELAPFLKDLSGAGTINATVTTQQAAEAEKFNQQLFQLQKNMTDAARSITSEMIPALNTFFTRLNGISAGGGFFKSLGLEVDANLASDRLRVVVGEIETLQATINRGRSTPAITARMIELRAEAAKLMREAAQASESLKEFAQTAKPYEETSSYQNEGPARGKAKPDIGKVGGGGKTGGATAAKDRLTDAQRYLENLQRQLQGTQDLSVAETVLADIQAGRLKLAKGESAQPLLDIAQQIDMAKRQADQIKAETEQVRELRAEQEKLKAAGMAVFEATRTPREKLTADVDELRDLLAKGAIDTDTYYRRIQQLDDAFDELGKAKDTIEELDSFTVRAAQNIQDALGDELSNVLDGDFKSIGNSFTKLLNRMVAEAAAAEIGRALFGDLKKGSGIGGFFGDLITAGAGLFGGSSNYNGNQGGINGGSVILPNSLRGGAATGTNLLERDMITLLHKGEAVVPKEYNPSAGGRGAGGVTVVINQSFAAGISRATSLQAAADARMAFERAGRNL